MSADRLKAQAAGAVSREQVIELEVAGKRWLIAKAGNLEDMWASMTGENPDDEDHIPYWTEIWPAAKVLAGYIHESRNVLHKKLCLDLGCGLGLTSLAGVEAGARVVAMDSQRPALEYAGRNSALNKIQALDRVQMDWRSPGFRPGIFDFIWGADVLYETRFCEPLSGIMKYCLKKDGKVWIADPRRNISEKVWKYFYEKNFSCRELRYEKACIDNHEAEVRLFELKF